MPGPVNPELETLTVPPVLTLMVGLPAPNEGLIPVDDKRRTPPFAILISSPVPSYRVNVPPL